MFICLKCFQRRVLWDSTFIYKTECHRYPISDLKRCKWDNGPTSIPTTALRCLTLNIQSKINKDLHNAGALTQYFISTCICLTSFMQTTLSYFTHFGWIFRACQNTTINISHGTDTYVVFCRLLMDIWVILIGNLEAT